MASEFPEAREAVRTLPSYSAGARPDGRPMWKLSSNENPNAPGPAILAALAEAAGAVNRYPDMAVADLTHAIAARHDVVTDEVAVGSGSVALIEDLLQAYCEAGDEVVYPWRSFEAYPICIQVVGATGVPVPLTQDGRHDVAALAAAVTPHTKVMILCSPNNPTGPTLTRAELRTLLGAVPTHVVVTLDSAYIDYARDPEATDGFELRAEFPNLVILRTFSKAYGLCGLRVGYALGHPEVLAPVRAASTPFGVNTLAQAAALAALGLSDAVAASVEENVRERARVVEAGRAAGWRIPDAQGNFFWLPLGEDSARFVAGANAKGLLVRGFVGDGVRISIGEPEANDLVIELLQEWRPAEGSAARSL